MRKIIQTTQPSEKSAERGVALFALCEDGTLWELADEAVRPGEFFYTWHQIGGIPEI